MSPLIFICASLLLALFIVTILLGGKSLDRIKARTVGHGQHGSVRWATRREIRSYYTMVPYEPQKWRTEPEYRPSTRASFSEHSDMVFTATILPLGLMPVIPMP